MAKASSRWQQLTHVVQASLAELQLGTESPLSLQRFSNANGWVLLLPIALLLLFLHWKLLLAVLLGVLTLGLVYLWQEQNWQPQWTQLLKRLGTANQRVLIAVGSGSFATLSSYLAIAIWNETDSPWIATGALLQGLGTFATLALLTTYLARSTSSHPEITNFDQMLADLTHNDPVKRLIAVRHLHRLANANTLDPLQQKTALECLRLLGSREREPILRAAIFDSLQALGPTQQLPPAQQPTFNPPAPQKRTSMRVPESASKANL